MVGRFTEQARQVLQLANDEALRLNHEYIGTEHILLGLLREGSGVAAAALKNHHIDLLKIRREVEKIVQRGPDMNLTGSLLPKTPRAKLVIEFAIAESRNLNHTHVGTEHLLLGLLGETEGVAAQVLMNLGLRLNSVRQEVVRLLTSPDKVVESITAQEPVTASGNSGDESDRLPDDACDAGDAFALLVNRLQEAKEAAVAAGDWEKAAYLRDLQNDVRMLWQRFMGLWPGS
jgi:ATP-dependent Clp protease ATP-binding subunit ClpC